jgi:predicted nucleic acid-binding protein
MISLLDTNVLIRFLTNDRSPKYKSLYSFFDSLELGHLQVELKLIVLFQTIFVLKSHYKVPKKDIAAALSNLLQLKGVAIKDKKIVMRTLALWREQNIEIVDCYLIACVEHDEQNILYSYDRDFDRYPVQRKEP